MIKDALGMIGVAMFFILPITVVIVLLILFSYAECDTFASINPDFDVMWVRYHGCMVKYNGMYIHVDDVVNVLQGR